MFNHSFGIILGLAASIVVIHNAAAAPVSINPPSTPSTIITTALKVTTSFSETSVTTPAQVKWSVIITNTGSTMAKSVTVENVLPVEFAYAEKGVPATLKALGDLAPGDTIAKTFAVNIPDGITGNRYIDEVTVSASNVDAQQYNAAIDVNGGKVLGATDSTLAETGMSPIVIFSFGLLTILFGVGVLNLKKT